MFQFLNKTKDYALGATAQLAAQKWIAPYGKMLDLKIDTQNKSISTSLLLKGESEPILIRLGRYQIEEAEGRSYVSIDPADLNISREWMNQLAQEKLKPGRYEIPQKFAWIIKMLG